MAKKRMTAKQRRYFGRKVRRAARRSYRGVRRAARRAYKRSGGLGGFMPSSIKETMVDFGAGFTLPYTQGFIAPYVDPYLQPILGDYTDEARIAATGALLSKFGGAIHPLVKEVGKKYWDYAFVSAGIQTAGKFGPTISGSSAMLSQYN